MSARLNPDAAAEVMRAAGLEPLGPYPGARAKWRCRCVTCGSDGEPTYANVQKIGAGCRPCGRVAAAAKHRTVSAGAAAALATERNLEPLEPYPGSTFPWRCRCLRCGAEVSPLYHNLKRGQGGCAPCGRIVRAAKQRGPEAAAVADLRAAGFDPLETFPGVMNPWLCRCLTCGKTVPKSLNDIRSGTTGCKWCLRLAVDPVAAAAVMQAAGLEPLVTYPGNGTPWECRCLRCLRVVRPRYSSVSAGQGGCRHCAKRGFCAAEEAVVYLIEHRAYGAVKVGIADAKGSRLRKHGRHGWQVLAVVQVRGERALAVEKSILGWWRVDLGLPPFLSKSEMSQFGWTETVDADAIDIPATIARIKSMAG
jgi:recombinational DNA repair protein (RecF pathway)